MYLICIPYGYLLLINVRSKGKMAISINTNNVMHHFKGMWVKYEVSAELDRSFCTKCEGKNGIVFVGKKANYSTR